MIFDQLPVPFGLIRYGVAADHQGTKAVTAQFERMFSSGTARFVGGIQIGGSLELEDILDAFDVVIWAVGLARDRNLGIPGEDTPGVYGSGVVSRLWNAHPGTTGAQVRIGRRVAIIGGGNVSLDLARLLIKPHAQLAGSDLDETFDESVPDPVEDVSILVRGEPACAKWDAAMIREFGSIEGLSVKTDPNNYASLRLAAEDGHSASSALLDLIEAESPTHLRARMLVSFGTRPIAVSGDSRVTGLEIEGPEGRQHLAVDTVLTAIGFKTDDSPDHPRVFAAGWARTGPRGTIPSLRTASRALASEVEHAVAAATGRGGISSLHLPNQKVTSFDDWVEIDAHEIASAPEDRCRKKIRDISSIDSLLTSTRSALT